MTRRGLVAIGQSADALARADRLAKARLEDRTMGTTPAEQGSTFYTVAAALLVGAIFLMLGLWIVPVGLELLGHAIDAGRAVEVPG
jgi:hypothetical protein